ncbi:signal transduction histidine kinase [Methanohalobium evestigatum Z-7303]|uniref:histidine kinase n=1 Tax=Methanohalobium evestigatum (strain ATCC BAA-1072 / DSM 3721 / NBRC 107634 / OCM 161 / Z-7303) TaxID=644295 RepID=D7E7E7_METEZ|nr:histidine kinase dimerization/phosphoacceptor domain -containing protein [Methanohalobium evestigatum]ADI73896.1 signal transduction histidine kinase [Methanohalobium evestigatum Z-7303]
MKWSNISLKVKLLVYILLGVSIILSASTAFIINSTTSQQEDLAYQQSIEKATSYANDFNTDMNEDKAKGENIATMLSEYESSNRSEVLNMLKRLLVQNKDLIGTYVAYEPDAFDNRDEDYVNTTYHDSTGRLIPYWNRIGGDVHCEPLVDYETSNYYQLPKKLEKTVVTEPYLYQGKLIVSYVSPIMKNGTFVGIGGVDVSLENIDNIVSDVEIFDTGYAFMSSNTGILLSHPEKKQWIGNKTLYDFDDPKISQMADEIQSGKEGHIETIDPSTGKNVVMFYQPIETGEYSFILVVPKDEMLAGVTELRDELIIISVVSLIFMGGVAYLISLSISRTINGIVGDFKRITNDVIDGKLGTRANTIIQKDFREIPQGLNKILDTFQSPIQETMRVANSLSKGRLSTRFRLNVKGDFKELGDTLDHFSESLNNVIDDSNAVLTAIQKEDFTRKVQVHGNGDFAILTNGVENARKAMYEFTTERKQAEEIRKKEIHHRVKNNLQVISSLLSLESGNFDDPDVVEAFRDSQNRVRSMALAHEELYQSKHVADIDFSEYVDNLTNYLIQTYRGKTNNIIINNNVDKISLNMDTAIPLGIIINELISNSLKHAFSDDATGEININMYVEGDNNHKLIVSDNGKGISDDIDFRESESLGLQLVNTLVEQIDGTIELDKSQGTEFIITFKELKYKVKV